MICSTFLQRACLCLVPPLRHCVRLSWKVRIINLRRKCPGDSAFRLWSGYCWLLSSRFTVWNTSNRQSTKSFLKHTVGQKSRKNKGQSQEGMIVEELSSIKKKKKPSTWHWDVRKTALRTPQQMTTLLHPTQGCKSVNSLKRQFLEENLRPPCGHRDG